MSQITLHKLRKQQKYCQKNPSFCKNAIRLNVFIKESSTLTFNKEYINTDKGSLDWHIWDWINKTKKIPLTYVKKRYLERNLTLDFYLHLINKNPILNTLNFTRELQHFLQLLPFNLISKAIVKKSNSAILIIE